MNRLLKSPFLYALVYFIINTQGTAQQIKQLKLSDSFTGGTVNAFEKDSLGYLWVGTEQGLSKYSGASFKTYTLNKGNLTEEIGVIDMINHMGKLYMINPEGSLFKYNYKYDKIELIATLENKRFLSIASLNKNELLIGLSTGFAIYDLKKQIFSENTTQKTNLNRVLIVHQNTIFVATSKGVCVFEYQADKKLLKQKKTILKGKDIIDIALDHDLKLWIGTELGGLYTYKNDKILKISIPSTKKKNYAIRKIEFDKYKNTLIAIDRLGLMVLDENNNIVKSYSHDVNNSNTISQNSIYSIFVDNTNAYWLGVREGTINIVYEKDNVFTNIKHIKNEPNSIHNNNIRAIHEDSKGNLWFGTENGFSKYNRKTKQWKNYNKSPLLYNTAVLAINEYKGDLLLGTYGDGLLKWNERTENVSQLNLASQERLSFIFKIETFENELWIGASDGPLSEHIDYNFNSSYNIGLTRTIIQGFDDILYAGSSSGFFEINKRNSSIRKIHQKQFNSSNEIYSLNLDQKNNCIWIGCNNGLFKYNLSNESLKDILNDSKKEMGPVFSIQKDNMQNLFLATISGIWQYNIKNDLFKKFNYNDGLKIKQFGFGASAKLKNGHIIFGGPKGATLFNPMELKKEKTLSNIYISNIEINGKKPDSITLAENINYTKKLKLNYDQNTLSFNCETIEFHGSKRNRFLWTLKGKETTTQKTFGNQKITYSNLRPGNYTLKIEGFNPDGVKGNFSKELDIIIKKPFWKTYWAISFYVLIVILIVYLIKRITLANTQKRVDENRIKFFVDVAHDIRTPVSLIQLLVKQLSTQENSEKSIELIQRNTQNLNEYVTQLLDFQKIDRKQLKLSVSKVDLKDILSKIIEDFTPILQEKSMDVKLNVKHIPVWFDRVKMKRIFYNLISNAIKYTNEGGEIIIKAFLSDNSLQIDFIDNGIGIPEKQQDLIFKRFTRGTNVSNKGIPGTGIGLMLSKKIVELHGGKIYLESKENIGSKFSIILPNGTEHYSSEELVDENIEEKDTQSKVEQLIHKDKIILLVEDTEELRKAVKEELSQNYTVIEAVDGKEGLLMALSKNPDLIITDVMMPNMDGKELCNLLKSNFKTSHIPVIMLTALSDIDNKLEGLQTGADAYVEKPFNTDILKVTINNLIKSRDTVKNLLEDKEVKKKMTPDESFLSDVIHEIKENLTSKDFSIDTLCATMGLSRSNLFRKLKGLIQLSPSDLIIKIKLGHAEELMKNKSFNRISDIAYESGFHDPKYFSTLFKKHYGKTPKEYIEEH